MEVIWINNVNYRVDEQALQWRPARCHRAAPIRGRVSTLCKTALIINNHSSIIWCIKSDVCPKLNTYIFYVTR